MRSDTHKDTGEPYDSRYHTVSNWYHKDKTSARFYWQVARY